MLPTPESWLDRGAFFFDLNNLPNALPFLAFGGEDIISNWCYFIYCMIACSESQRNSVSHNLQCMYYGYCQCLMLVVSQLFSNPSMIRYTRHTRVGCNNSELPEGFCRILMPDGWSASLFWRRCKNNLCSCCPLISWNGGK